MFHRRRKPQVASPMNGGFTIAGVALISRIARRWNQTGQKFAGEPDIVTLLSKNNIILWILVTAAYALPSRRLCRLAAKWHPSIDFSLLPVPVTMIALLFKLSFTAADAPELVEGIHIIDPVLSSLEQISLVLQARAVFFSLFVLLAGSLILDPAGKQPKSSHGTYPSPIRSLSSSTTEPQSLPRKPLS